MRKLSQVLMLTAYLALGTFAQHAGAESNAFHQESKRYLVYLGVVPASLLKKEPERVDRDKQLHGGIAAQTPAAQHVMVTIFRKDGNVRVLDATVIATVRPGKLFTRKAEEKPLEKMLTRWLMGISSICQKWATTVLMSLFMTLKIAEVKVCALIIQSSPRFDSLESSSMLRPRGV